MRVIAVAALLCAVPAAAHDSASRSGSLYRERYLICNGAKARDRVACVGPHQARAALLKSLALGPFEHKNLDYWIEPARENAVWAAYFHVRDAIVPLRAWLDIKLAKADRDDHLMLDKLGVQAEAAFALARLGDRESAAKIAAIVRAYETESYGSLWSDTFDALVELDPARASRYAIDFVSRQTDFRTSMPGGSDKLHVLDAIVAADADRANPVLAKLAAREERGYDHAHCELMATRVRLDPALHAKVRDMFAASYSGTWLAGCAESVLRRLPPDPGDADILVRHLGRDDAGMDFGVANLAYERILDLEVALANRRDQAADAARTTLRKGLAERSKWPHVADPSHRNYSPHFVALHYAALAGLGDSAAAKRVARLVDDAKDTTGTAWLASLYELRLGLPGAVDRAAALIVRGVGYANDERSGLFRDVRTRVLDAFVARAPDDARWVGELADRHGDTREHALDLLARRAPKRACEAAIAAATHADVEAANFAFLALTALGDTCEPALGALADDHAAPNEIRGAAVEALAALDSPHLCDHLRTAYGDHVFQPALSRATDLRKPNCSR